MLSRVLASFAKGMVIATMVLVPVARPAQPVLCLDMDQYPDSFRFFIAKLDGWR